MTPSLYLEISADKKTKRGYLEQTVALKGYKEKRSLAMEKQVAEENLINNEGITYQSGSF